MEDYLVSLPKLWTIVHDQPMRQAEADKQRADKVQRKSDKGPGDKVLFYTNHLKLNGKPGKL